MAKYLFVYDGYNEVVECEPDSLWQYVTDIKYPESLIAITRMDRTL